MPVVRTAVLLFAFPAGQMLNLRGDILWYNNYFFGPVYGQAGYWIKQTDAQLVVDGQVFDWALVSDPNPTLTNRKAVIDSAIKAMENDRGINFNGFDIVVLVLGVPPNVNTDGGSTTAKSEDRNHAGIVIRVGDPFDFVAHELGHALGLNHSFGNLAYQNASWSQPGEYGHPYCVMSARGYGGIGGPYFPASPRDGRPEYSGLGPSLNAGTALGRGWVNAQVHQLPGIPIEVELRSRHWLGKFGATPQALEVQAPDGKTYVLEYREDANWDQGQGSPVLIINAAKGSTADLAHPNTSSATYVGLIRLPVSFGGPGSVFNGPGFGIEILDRVSWSHSLRFRLRPGRVGVTPIVLTSKKESVSTTTVGAGTTTFAPGDAFCVQGTWPYEKLERLEVATFEATYAPAIGAVTAAWSVDGVALTPPNASKMLPEKTVNVANAMLKEQLTTRPVTVRFEIDAIPKGSRLRLFNQPTDDTYDLRVGCTLTTAIGMGSAEEWTAFEGIEYRYPQRFYDERDACIETYRDIARRYVRYKVLLEPDLWKRVTERLMPRVEQLVELLGPLHERGEEQAYRTVVTELARLIGTTTLTPLVVSRDEVAKLTPQIVEREPHFAQQRV